MPRKSSKAKKAKINVTYILHMKFNGMRKMYQIVHQTHYKKNIISSNTIPMEGVYEDIALKSSNIRKAGVGAIDMYSEHPDIREYEQIASYNVSRQKLTWKPVIAIFEPSKKSKKVPNESILYHVVLTPKQSGG